jgi:hypothetical protein
MQPWKRNLIVALILLLLFTIPATMASFLAQAWSAAVTFFDTLKAANGWH